MKVKICKLLFITSTLLFLSCKSKKIDNSQNNIVITEKLLNKEIKSPDKTKILKLTYLNSIEPRKEFNYLVIDLKNKSELIKGVFFGTKMDWKDNNTIIGYLHIGMIQEESQNNTENTYKLFKIKK